MFEIGLSSYDLYTTMDTIVDPDSSLQDKVFTASGFAIGAVSPGGGYSELGKGMSKGYSYLYDMWHKGTFNNKLQSVLYHLRKHGKGRTAAEYTKDAMDLFAKNKGAGTKVKLEDGTEGIKIQTKVKDPTTGKMKKVGGFWTDKGELVTFWD